MKVTAIAPLLVAAGAIAQSCDGDDFNTNGVSYCCMNGEFSGPVISSISAVFSSESVSRSAFQSSLQASLSSKFGNSGIQTDAAQITAAPRLVQRRQIYGRAITTEVSSGLTCIGDSVSSSSGSGADGASVIIGGDSSTTGSASTTDVASTTGSVSAESVTSTSSKTGGMPMITPGPVIAMGAAAAAFAYGAM